MMCAGAVGVFIVGAIVLALMWLIFTFRILLGLG